MIERPTKRSSVAAVGEAESRPVAAVTPEAGASSAEIRYDPTRGVYIDCLAREARPHQLVLLDAPLTSKAFRSAFIRIVRDIDFEGSAHTSEIDAAAISYYGGRRGVRKNYTVDQRPWVPVNGLATRHSVPELLGGCRIDGAEGLVALTKTGSDPGWYAPIGYMNYWSSTAVPEYLSSVADIVRKNLPKGEVFLLADTVVALDSAPRGMYRALLAHAAVELAEKAKGIRYVYDIVRFEPNPNLAMHAHEALGWTQFTRPKSGEPVVLAEKMISEITGEPDTAKFLIVRLDLQSLKIAELKARAAAQMAEQGILSLDLDGEAKTYRELLRGALDQCAYQNPKGAPVKRRKPPTPRLAE